MASGATDLINEAATSKITGEEERYSNTDFIVFQANVDGAMEVVDLLKPYLQKTRPGAAHADPAARTRRSRTAIAKYKATPGYDDTGYVEYSTVLDTAAAPALRRRAGLRRGAVQDPRAGRLTPDGGPAQSERPEAPGSAVRPGPVSAPCGCLGAVRPSARRRPASPAGAADRHRRCGRHSAATSPADRLPSTATHQAGIVTPAQDRLAFATFNVVDGHQPGDLRDLLRGLDRRGRAT